MKDVTIVSASQFVVTGLHRRRAAGVSGVVLMLCLISKKSYEKISIFYLD